MRRIIPATFSAFAIGGCNWSQSALAPRGSHAEIIAELTWVMTIGGGIIFVAVMGLAAAAALGPPRWRGLIGRQSVIVGGGIVFPVVTLTALLVYGLVAARALVSDVEPALRIEVIGERWWWRVNYLDPSGATRFATANEIRVPTGEQVEFVLKSADVIHSFWAPNLAGKLDMIPGRVNAYQFQADRPGIYRGQCAEYCGEQHALMAFYVVAETPEDYSRWLAGQESPAPEPQGPELQRGRDLFLANGCGACHVVRGTPAAGDVGPDLTHIGGRLSLAAGTLPNTVGTLAAWIASAQHLKPGNLMPSFSHLDGEELRAIAVYLESLK